jgi:hypothetical protein
MAVDEAEKKLEQSVQKLGDAQDKFGKKYNINFISETSELTTKLKKAKNALEYHKDIGRSFLKANREIIVFSEAIGQKDVASLEQSAPTMVTFAEEGLARLSRYAPFKGDSSIIMAARNLLLFYKQDGKTRGPANVDFFLHSDQFEKVIKKFNTIKPNKRTEKDIRIYNKAVAEFNKAAKQINKTNKKAHKTHRSLLKIWEKKSKKFLKTHG